MNDRIEITEFQVFFTDVEQSIPSVDAFGSLWIGDAGLAMPRGTYRVIDGALYKIGIEHGLSWPQAQSVTDH